MAIDSLRTKLRQYMVKGFKTIQADRGYNFSVLAVHEMMSDYENIVEGPCINIMPVQEKYSSAGQGGGRFTLGMVEKIIVFVVDFIIPADEDSILAEEQAISDMETYLGTYYMFPDPDFPSNHGCREAIIVSNKGFGLAVNKRFIGVSFTIHCYLGQYIRNPGVRA
jgi:hypothetical protein